MVLSVFVINVCIYNNIVFIFHAFDLFTIQAVFIEKLEYFICVVLLRNFKLFYMFAI